MRLAVQQPYYFPYIGYFHLVRSADLFVFLDDVQFSRGWINRNRIRSMCPRGWNYITIPVRHHDRHATILDIRTAGTDWVSLHRRMLEHAYGHGFRRHQLGEAFAGITLGSDLATIARRSVTATSDFLGLETRFSQSSGIETGWGGQERIIRICKHFAADTYLNLPGGRTIYDGESFAREGITLEFVDPPPGNHLSVLDLCCGEGLVRL